MGEVVLRPYRRGGFVRHLNERTYASPARFQAEYAVHARLWESGFPTVEPLGYAHRPSGLGVEGLYITRFEEATPWPRAWERSGEVLPALARMLEALCALGLWAPDLNATNVLITAGGQVIALDWDRARMAEPRGLAERYRARLRRSLEKLQAPPAVRMAMV